MLREEKRFRGKVLDISFEGSEVKIPFDDWVYGGIVYDAVNNEFQIVQIDEEKDECRRYLPLEHTIGASTFKKDREGTWVFEGDVLSVRAGAIGDGELFFVVLNDHGDLGVVGLKLVKEDNWMYNTIPVNRPMGEEIISQSRVIGNIIDNPEWVATHQGEY